MNETSIESLLRVTAIAPSGTSAADRERASGEAFDSHLREAETGSRSNERPDPKRSTASTEREAKSTGDVERADQSASAKPEERNESNRAEESDARNSLAADDDANEEVNESGTETNELGTETNVAVGEIEETESEEQVEDALDEVVAFSAVVTVNDPTTTDTEAESNEDGLTVKVDPTAAEGESHGQGQQEQLAETVTTSAGAVETTSAQNAEQAVAIDTAEPAEAIERAADVVELSDELPADAESDGVENEKASGEQSKTSSEVTEKSTPTTQAAAAELSDEATGEKLSQDSLEQAQLTSAGVKGTDSGAARSKGAEDGASDETSSEDDNSAVRPALSNGERTRLEPVTAAAIETAVAEEAVSSNVASDAGDQSSEVNTRTNDTLPAALSRLHRGPAGNIQNGRVAEAGQMPRAEAARFVGRVVRAFETAAERGGPLQLRLSPPELGSMRLELSIKQGVLTATVETETNAARQVLLDNLPALRDRLAAQNMRVEQFDVDVRQEGGGDGRPDLDTEQQDDRGHESPLGERVLTNHDVEDGETETVVPHWRLDGDSINIVA